MLYVICYICYQIILLVEDACFLVGHRSSEFGDRWDRFFSLRLTIRGHEFLDKIRTEDDWKKTKSEIGEIPIAVFINKLILNQDEINIQRVVNSALNLKSKLKDTSLSVNPNTPDDEA